MASKKNSLSAHSVQPTMPQYTARGQADQSQYTNKDKYFFQPPITGDQSQMSGENRDEWKRISCNFCRRRKVKCDKRDPCGQCSISFRDCVYPERSRRGTKRTKSSSSRLDVMEKRLKVIESNQLYPSPAVDTTATASAFSSPRIELPLENLQTSPNPASKKTDSEEIGKCATAHHFIEQGEIEFHGTSSDRTFMEELMEKLGDSSVTHQRIPIDSSVPGLFQSDARYSDEVPLPGREQAMRIVEAALDAQVLLHIIHRPSFDVSFNMIYSLESPEYTLREKRFLPLLYAVLAYGSLFIDPYAERLEYDEVITRASRYFIKSKQLQDIASCNDLVSLQAIAFKNLFLLYTTRTPSCYTYLCASMSVALRMGLHRSFCNTQDVISREISKRVFWALKLLSSEVATCIGLPTLVNDEDSDQELPLEVNDVYIHGGKVTRPPPNEICYASGSICNSRLQSILHRVMKDVYPRKGRASVEICGSMNYIVKVDTIRKIEQELEKWQKAIPLGYRLGTYYQDRAVQRAQFVLALTYSYIHLRLYRPFLHYDIETCEQTKPRRSTVLSPCASACVQACRNIIELCEDTCRWGLLTEASWPTIRILTSCMLTILYITLMHQDPYEEDMLFKAFATGRKILHIMEKRSHQARRSKTIFKIIISSLSIKFDHVREKLMKHELEAPNVRQCDLSSVSDEYTALLGEKVFALSSKRYLSRSLKLRIQDGFKNDGTHLTRPNNLHRELKEAISLQPRLFSDQTGQGSTPIATAPASKILNTSLKSEDSPIQDPSEGSDVPGSFIPSVQRPMPGDFLLAGPTMGLQQEEPNGSWMHAFDSVGSTGNVYSPVKDLIGDIGLHMDDINEFSDIWDWF